MAVSTGISRDPLDRALERVSGLEFQPPVRFVNHGPMACEALSVLGAEESIEAWVSGFEASMVVAAEPRPPGWGPDVAWWDNLGDSRLRPEWIGYFQQAIEAGGCDAVIKLWVPRLMPGLAAALFHGVIRTAHAVRAVNRRDSLARRTELAHALGNWSAWCRPGEPVDNYRLDEEPGRAAVDAARRGATAYARQPSIYYLHGITGAMAVDLLAPFLTPEQAAAAVAHLRAEHANLYRGTPDGDRGTNGDQWPAGVIGAAVSSRDPHQVKLVEACRRGYAASQDDVFCVAAETVTRASPAFAG